jgi:anti-sigma B factor antagonist
MSLQIHTRELPDVVILDLDGRITLGEGASSLRQAVKDLLMKGERRIILNLTKVQYVDSAGLGELVGIYVTVRNQGGEVKMTGVNSKILGLMQVTKLHTIFDVRTDESAALAAFGSASAGV